MLPPRRFRIDDGEQRITNNVQRDDATIEDRQAHVDEWRKKLEAQADDLNTRPRSSDPTGLAPVARGFLHYSRWVSSEVTT